MNTMTVGDILISFSFHETPSSLFSGWKEKQTVFSTVEEGRQGVHRVQLQGRGLASRLGHHSCKSKIVIYTQTIIHSYICIDNYVFSVLKVILVFLLQTRQLWLLDLWRITFTAPTSINAPVFFHRLHNEYLSTVRGIYSTCEEYKVCTSDFTYCKYSVCVGCFSDWKMLPGQQYAVVSLHMQWELERSQQAHRLIFVSMSEETICLIHYPRIRGENRSSQHCDMNQACLCQKWMIYWQGVESLWQDERDVL